MPTRLAVFTLFLLVAVGHTVRALPLPPWEEDHESVRPCASALHTRIPRGSACEKILMNAAVSMGRPMTAEEIESQLEKILAITGEKLLDLDEPVALPEPIPAPAPHIRSTPRCFTAAMKILTPNGEKAIGELQKGDAVISLDITQNRWVVNHVNEVLVTPDRTYGILADHPAPLEVTAEERFYTDGDQYLPLQAMTAASSIFKIEILEKGAYRMTRAPRGSYEMSPACATVFNLNLIGEPRNFIVNGILVHNIKESL